MEEVEAGFLDADIRVAVADAERHRAEITDECIKVWDSMSGGLPPFEEFCRFYVSGAFKRWIGKARWN